MRSPVPPADRRYAGANDPRMERRMLAALIWTITAGTVALLAAAARVRSTSPPHQSGCLAYGARILLPGAAPHKPQ